MTTHPVATAGTSQCDLILARLSRTPGEWVPMPALMRVSRSAVVHSRIADLRRRGHRIDHRNRIVKRRCHSEYRLAEAAAPRADLDDSMDWQGITASVLVESPPPPMDYVNCGSGQDYGICSVCGRGHGHVAFQQ